MPMFTERDFFGWPIRLRIFFTTLLAITRLLDFEFITLPYPTRNWKTTTLQGLVLAASSLPPPKYGSLWQAASAYVQRLQADRAQSERKRPLPFSPSAQPLSPMAQRIRKDLQISENEVGSPERELLRTQIFPEKSPPPSPPCVKDIPSPAHLVFTPSKTEEDTEIPLGNVKDVKCCNCELLMTPEHQCGEITPVSPSQRS